MSTPSPGPGWWMASDGKWYPQQWQTKHVYHSTRGDLEKLVNDIAPLTKSLGLEGWELVSSSVQHTQVGRELARDGSGILIFEYSIVSAFKRPLLPE